MDEQERNRLAKDAATLQAAAAVMRRYFGGLEGTITDLNRKAEQLLFWAAESDLGE